MTKDPNIICVPESATIKDAMASIHESGIRVALIVNDDKKLVGVITDGDIREGLLLKGKTFDSPVAEIMNKNPTTATKDTPASILLETMLEKSIYEIPILNEDGIVTDIILLSELKQIPLAKQDITAKEVEAINEVLNSPYLSIGPKAEEFEAAVAKYVGVKHAVAVNSGTSGLHLLVRAFDIKDGDEVITTPFSFIASANAALFERAKPIFVDIDEKTLCIDPAEIEEKITPRTKAILPVHAFGYPADMDAISEIAKKHNLVVIEDAAEALGSAYKGRKAGSLGDGAIFGFYPNKQITTGEGGMVLTDNEEVAKLCRSMRNQGREEGGGWFNAVRLGYNYRMHELSAALGVVQMSRIDEMLQRRMNVANLYTTHLKSIEDVITPYLGPDTKMSWFVYVIRLNPEKFSRKERGEIIKRLGEHGISSREYFSSIHLQPLYVQMFGYKEGDFPITERVANSTIALPFHNNLTEAEIKYVSDTLKSALEEIKG